MSVWRALICGLLSFFLLLPGFSVAAPPEILLANIYRDEIEPAGYLVSEKPDFRCGNPDAPPNRFYAYGVVGRLACLAAAVELDRTAPEAE